MLCKAIFIILGPFESNELSHILTKKGEKPIGVFERNFDRKEAEKIRFNILKGEHETANGSVQRMIRSRILRKAL